MATASACAADVEKEEILLSDFYLANNQQTNRDLNNEVESDKDGDEEERENWDKKIDFLLSIIGFAVDLANVWRFPYYCYKNGGGAFLIPYFTMLIFGATPIFFMELVLGQCHRKGAVAIWKLVPLFKGIGYCQCLIAYFVAFYYNVIIAWSFFYLVASFSWTLPWTSCSNSWNTDTCRATNSNIIVVTSYADMAAYANDTDPMTSYVNVTNIKMVNSTAWTSSTAEYFERSVLGLHNSNGVENIGNLNWRLVLCLLLVFTIIFFSIWRGVKTSGKVVWVTATVPYIVLLVLLVRGLMLPGAYQGILYFITPRIYSLGYPSVWIDAAVQIFFSVGAGFGVHIAFASYNQRNDNCYRACLVTVVVNSLTSLLSGLVIFSYLGYMAHIRNSDISQVADEGPSLVFVVYPEAISTLPASMVWSIIFFIMLITLGLDSAMGGLEAILTGLKDELKFKFYGYERHFMTTVLVFSAFLFALPNVTYGGMYLVHMWDTFAANTSILIGVFCEAVAISWIYGLNEFCADVKSILNFQPSIFWRICWKFISPLFILIIIISSIMSYKPLEYTSNTLGKYVYPGWANVIGWMIAFASSSCIPIYAIYKIFTTSSHSGKQKLALLISPTWEHEDIIKGIPVKRFKRKHWITF